MAKKKKEDDEVQTMEGWGFQTPVHDMAHADMKINEQRIAFCTPERHMACEKEGKCNWWHLGMSGQLDSLLRANGYTPSKGSLMCGRKKDWKIAERLLKKYLKQCHKWKILVEPVGQ